MLGLCCQFLEPRTKRDGSTVFENSINEQSMQLGRFKSGAYNTTYIQNVYRNNVEEVIKLIPKLVANNIHCFRLSSNIFSLWEFNSHIAKQDDLLISRLNHCGNLFKINNIRVTTHPGQFTVLSSDSDDVVCKSIMELDYHAWTFDQMNLPQSPDNAINIHGGKADRSSKLISVINSLPNHIKSRLTLENDETSYNLMDLINIHDATGVPVCWDSHHHVFNDAGIPMDEAFHLATMTWNKTGCKPLQHISNTTPGQENGNYTERRKHSDYIHYVPQPQLLGLQNNVIDLEVEAKMKNLAISKMRNDFNVQ